MDRRAVVVVCLALAAASCGGGSSVPTAPAPAATTVAAVVPVPVTIAPTRWPVTGRVLAGPGGDAIAGASLTFGSATPVTSSATGEYSIVTADDSTQRLLISAPGFHTRETYLRGGTERALDIDLISPAMPLWLAMAHNGSQAPQSVSMTPTMRWTQNPNIYIWTTWKDTGAPVNNVDWYVREIRRVIPQLTGFTLEAGVIETGPAERPRTPGWINVQFHHGGNYAYLGRNPGEVQFAGDGTCNYIAVTHEMGHAMGFWHTGANNTIMGSTPGYCREADLTPNELKVAKAMYSRAPMNYFPDRDSPSSSALGVPSARMREGEKVLCDLPVK